MKSIAAVWSLFGRHHAPHQHISSLGEALEKVLFRALIVVMVMIAAAFALAPGSLQEKAARFAFYYELKQELDFKPIAFFEPAPLPVAAKPEVKIETLAAGKVLSSKPAPVMVKKEVLKRATPAVRKAKAKAVTLRPLAGTLGTFGGLERSQLSAKVNSGFGVFEGRVKTK